MSRNLLIAPEMDPMAQQSWFRLAQDHSVPSTCLVNFSDMMVSVFRQSKWVK